MITDERNSLVVDNLGLVHSCAKRFRGRGVDYDDLFQAGCIGLVKAAGGFCPEKGFAFSTYAVPAILGEIKRIFRDGGAVKVGRSVKEKSRELLIRQEELTARLGRSPSVGELAEYVSLDAAETAMLLCAALPPLSLTGDADDGEPQIDIPSDMPEEQITDKIALSQVLETLPERDRRIIEMRYFKGLTQTAAAKELDMSQVQVSRREKAILMYLRNKLS